MKLPRTIDPFVRASRLPWWIARRVMLLHPYFRFVTETSETQTPATLEAWFDQHVRLQNNGPYWPVHPSSVVTNWYNVLAGVETSPGLMPGCYIAALDKIYIGDYTQIAPNVGIIAGNHRPEDNRRFELGEVKIGEYCWIGMGAVILPNVVLGDFTVVGAGAIVSRSFPEGHCVLAGVPARLLKKLDPATCVRHRSEHEYHGYIRKADFPEFRRKYLKV